MLAIRQSAHNGLLPGLGRNFVSGPVVTCPICSDSFYLYAPSTSLAAAEKLLVDYLRRYCPKHVEYFAAGENAIRAYCPECAEAYGILGLWQGEGNQKIKVAYRELAKKWHPDTFSERGDVLRQEAEERFKVICGAYRHLMSHA